MAVKIKKAVPKKSATKKMAKKVVRKAKPIKTTQPLKKMKATQIKRKVTQLKKLKGKVTKPQAKKKISAKQVKSSALLVQSKKKKVLKKPAAKKVAIKKTVAVAIPAKKTKPTKKNNIRKTKVNEKVNAETIANNIGIPGIEPYMTKDKENYMSSRMSEHFRNILLAWKTRLIEEADRTVHHMQDEAANFPDPTDRATQEEEFNLELRARDRERKLIKKIDDALFMLGEGLYGHCEACGEPIGLRRLEARPTATLCVECKTLDEIREKQQGS